MRDFGPFAIAVFLGCILGLLVASNLNLNSNALFHRAGDASLVAGGVYTILVFTISRKLAMKGVPGGLLIGFGLGATLGFRFFPWTPPWFDGGLSIALNSSLKILLSVC